MGNCQFDEMRCGLALEKGKKGGRRIKERKRMEKAHGGEREREREVSEAWRETNNVKFQKQRKYVTIKQSG